MPRRRSNEQRTRCLRCNGSNLERSGIHITLSQHPVIAVCDEQGSELSTTRLDCVSQDLQGYTRVKLDWSPHPKGDTYITASGG